MKKKTSKQRNNQTAERPAQAGDGADYISIGDIAKLLHKRRSQLTLQDLTKAWGSLN